MDDSRTEDERRTMRFNNGLRGSLVQVSLIGLIKYCETDMYSHSTYQKRTC